MIALSPADRDGVNAAISASLARLTGRAAACSRNPQARSAPPSRGIVTG